MKYLKLYPDCIPVEGWSRSLIVNFHTKNLIFIPNALYEILTEHKGKSVEQIKESYNNEHDEVIEQYYAYLLKSNFVFPCNGEEQKYFPDLSLKWSFPAIISNAIIENSGLKNIETILEQLEELCCKAIMFKINDCEYEIFTKILEAFSKTKIPTAEFALEFNHTVSEDELFDLISSSPRIQKTIIFSSNRSEIIYSHNSKSTNIMLTRTKLLEGSCGFVSPKGFMVNIPFFTESQNHNNCLNHKISINKRGEIKNCLSMEKSYGNICEISLQEAIENPEFKEFWSVCKDKIDVCCDCEFRYICLDCRAFKKDNSNFNSQPLNCGYNPYIAKWNGEVGYISVEEWEANNQ